MQKRDNYKLFGLSYLFFCRCLACMHCLLKESSLVMFQKKKRQDIHVWECSFKMNLHRNRLTLNSFLSALHIPRISFLIKLRVCEQLIIEQVVSQFPSIIFFKPRQWGSTKIMFNRNFSKIYSKHWKSSEVN